MFFNTAFDEVFFSSDSVSLLVVVAVVDSLISVTVAAGFDFFFQM